MITATTPPVPFVPFAFFPVFLRTSGRLPVRAVSISPYLQYPQQNTNPLPLFATRALYFHQITDSWPKQLPKFALHWPLFKHLPLFISSSHISNALNKIRTLLPLFAALLFVSSTYRLFSQKQEYGGICRPNNQWFLIHFDSKKGKAPDRLGGGNPGLGG